VRYGVKHQILKFLGRLGRSHFVVHRYFFEQKQGLATVVQFYHIELQLHLGAENL
jgi:hypothetical protein